MPTSEVMKAVLNPFSRLGMLSLMFSASKLRRPMNMPRNVPKMPNVIAAAGASFVSSRQVVCPHSNVLDSEYLGKECSRFRCTRPSVTNAMRSSILSPFRPDRAPHQWQDIFRFLLIPLYLPIRLRRQDVRFPASLVRTGSCYIDGAGIFIINGSWKSIPSSG